MDKFGLIGYPLGHSFSVGYFNEKFQNEGINAQYHNFEIPNINSLQEVLAIHPQLKGFNVTIPYKQQIIPFLDEISSDAQAIGAVNVVKIIKRGNQNILKGYNSDIIGFTRSIENMLEPCHKKALVLGTGGSAKAILHGLQSLGIETKLVSRRKQENVLLYNEITKDIIQEYSIIVNCTPCGMYPHTEECPPLPYEAMSNKTLLYDLIYNPDETLFMKKGKEFGATVKNGLEMLLLQAFASWEIWNNKDK